MKLTRQQKRQVMLVSGTLFYLLAFISSNTLAVALYLVAYLILGRNIIRKVLKNLHFSTLFDENFLMLVATLGAMALNQLEEAVAVLLFYQIGEYFQDLAVDQSRKSIADLMDINPDSARVLKDGHEIIVDPSDVKIADLIVVKPGEKIALDGIVVSGESNVDTSMLTGESLAQFKDAGSEVLSGCINCDSVLTIRVTQNSETSTVTKILDLVENASSRKSNSENFITIFARYYTPIVVFLALGLAFIPPLLTKDLFSVWIYRALVFLVVSCPCALVLSIPLSFFGGLGGASRLGILIKGGNYLEALSHVDTIVFDKTGTLTKGQFVVDQIDSFHLDPQLILDLSSHAEAHLSHPIALSLHKAYQKDIVLNRIKNVKDIPGKGVIATIDDKEVIIGNAKLFKDNQIGVKKSIHLGTELMVAINGKHEANIFLVDEIKEDALAAIKQLKALKIKNITMLSGDKKENAEAIGKQLHIKHVKAELLPQDKVAHIEKLLSQQSKKSKLIFVGDGINDAPSLAISDIGIAMGALGSDAAIEAADVVILNDEVTKVSQAIRHAKRTMNIVHQNIALALGIKIGTLILASFGLANMWLAIFADVGVALLAVLNASRILKIK